MTKKEVLTAYRQGVIELREMEHQLDLAGGDGRPRGVHGVSLEGAASTNHADAAAWQLADGLMAQVQRKRQELAALSARVAELIGQIGSLRLFMIVQHYYMMAETDETIARMMNSSRSRVTQLRLEYLHAE